MTDFNLGILGANGIVGGGIPIAVGAGLTFQQKREPRVALSFFGDGATNEGSFHEALNLAGLWKLPVIFFCENNLYGEGTPQAKQAPVADLAIRASSYAMPGVTVDGNDVLAVYEATQAAVDRARTGGGPTLIEGKTYRQRGHYEGDPMIYRSKEEMDEWKGRDPVVAFRARLLTEAGIPEAELVAVEQAVQAAWTRPSRSPPPAPSPRPRRRWRGCTARRTAGWCFDVVRDAWYAGLSCRWSRRLKTHHASRSTSAHRQALSIRGTSHANNHLQSGNLRNHA